MSRGGGLVPGSLVVGVLVGWLAWLLLPVMILKLKA
jgi:hypothetical protein